MAAAPVVLDGVVLFRVRGVSSLPAETRARLIGDRIAEVAADRTIEPGSLHVVEGEGVSRIVARGVPVVTLVDADAALEGLHRKELASAHLAKVQEAIADYRAARTPGAMRRSIVNAVGAGLVLALAVAALAWSWRRVDRFLERRLTEGVRSVEIRSFRLMRGEAVWRAARSVLVALRAVVLLGILLLFLSFVLDQFPWTRGLSRGMAAFALRPLQEMGEGLLSSIPSLVFLAVLFLAVRLGLRAVRLFFDAVGRGAVTLQGFDREWAEPTYKIIRIAAIAFALIVAYPYIPGSDTAAFKGVSVFIGVVFSLGSSSVVSNIIAGYMMTYRRALKVGDRVRIGDAVGDVIETRLQVTHLRSPKNEEIIVPNSQILAGEVTNYSSLARVHGLILHTEVGIGYDTPWRQVEAMLLLAAERTEGVAREPRPFVLEKKLGDFAVVYELNAYCDNPQAMNLLYAALHRNVLDVFNEYGVQIMTPAYEGDTPEPKVVAPNDWFAAPADTTPSDTAPAGTSRLQPSRRTATGQPTPHS